LHRQQLSKAELEQYASKGTRKAIARFYGLDIAELDAIPKYQAKTPSGQANRSSTREYDEMFPYWNEQLGRNALVMALRKLGANI